MALTYTADPTTTRCRRRLHLHFKHRHQGALFFTGIFHKRYLFFLSILYIVGLITCAGRLLTILHPPPPPPPGALYRSQDLFLKLWPEIQSDNGSTVELDNIWRYRRKLKEQRPCLNANARQQPVSSWLRRYLVVDANGGLNQQRSSICNAVAVAGLLNATLVIPRFDIHNDHFISTLKDFVTVVHDLPNELLESYNFSISNIPNFRVQAWTSARYYLDEVYPVLQESGLATSIPPHIQHLRCLANYKALRFSPTIMNLAKKVVNRMVAKSLNSGGKYVSVHLRFEEDMVAFSCCVYDGGEIEKYELDAIREKGWAKKFMQKGRIYAPDLNRVNGRCPMTPVEVGMMLRGMGFSNDTPIYLASGKIYKEERYLEPLRKMFPLLHTKESLATADELAAIQGYSSRLAALDYMVCLSSEIFVTTQGGNFPHFLMGHRRFVYNGHAKTIMPDKSKLVVLFQNTSISWDSFKDEMETMLAESDRKSIMVPRVKKSTRKGSIYLNPLPECRCLWESQNSSSDPLDMF
ncbi:uncharacterized protein at1g04910 [Phtheirospermum japonicum]|uniref:O-fucosyltransferase family protein n=1 Tax=Phtheirospermum japonicum TaxID=374723 RepID=A0A830C032_9LAMI|nr:uncharacterized protein at1g04910 [Phtheirospermum japonicum]